MPSVDTGPGPKETSTASSGSSGSDSCPSAAPPPPPAACSDDDDVVSPVELRSAAAEATEATAVVRLEAALRRSLPLLPPYSGVRAVRTNLVQARRAALGHLLSSNPGFKARRNARRTGVSPSDLKWLEPRVVVGATVGHTRGRDALDALAHVPRLAEAVRAVLPTLPELTAELVPVTDMSLEQWLVKDTQAARRAEAAAADAEKEGRSRDPKITNAARRRFTVLVIDDAAETDAASAATEAVKERDAKGRDVGERHALRSPLWSAVYSWLRDGANGCCLVEWGVTMPKLLRCGGPGGDELLRALFDSGRLTFTMPADSIRAFPSAPQGFKPKTARRSETSSGDGEGERADDAGSLYFDAAAWLFVARKNASSQPLKKVTIAPDAFGDGDALLASLTDAVATLEAQHPTAGQDDGAHTWHCDVDLGQLTSMVHTVLAEKEFSFFSFSMRSAAVPPSIVVTTREYMPRVTLQHVAVAVLDIAASAGGIMARGDTESFDDDADRGPTKDDDVARRRAAQQRPAREFDLSMEASWQPCFAFGPVQLRHGPASGAALTAPFKSRLDVASFVAALVQLDRQLGRQWTNTGRRELAEQVTGAALPAKAEKPEAPAHEGADHRGSVAEDAETLHLVDPSRLERGPITHCRWIPKAIAPFAPLEVLFVPDAFAHMFPADQGAVAPKAPPAEVDALVGVQQEFADAFNTVAAQRRLRCRLALTQPLRPSVKAKATDQKLHLLPEWMPAALALRTGPVEPREEPFALRYADRLSGAVLVNDTFALASLRQALLHAGAAVERESLAVRKASEEQIVRAIATAEAALQSGAVVDEKGTVSDVGASGWGSWWMSTAATAVSFDLASSALRPRK